MIFEADYNIEEVVYHKDGQKGIIIEIVFRPKESVMYNIQWAHDRVSFHYDFELSRKPVEPEEEVY